MQVDPPQPISNDLEPINFPIDPTSTVIVIAAAGVAILLVWIGYPIAYRLIRKLIHSMGGVV